MNGENAMHYQRHYAEGAHFASRHLSEEVFRSFAYLDEKYF